MAEEPKEDMRRPRNVWVSDQTWEHVRVFSEESGRSITNIVERALSSYVSKQCTCEVCRPHRKKRED